MFYLVNRISYSSPPCFLRCEHLFISPLSPLIRQANGVHAQTTSPLLGSSPVVREQAFGIEPRFCDRAPSLLLPHSINMADTFFGASHILAFYLYICRSSSRAFTPLLLSVRHRTECHRTWAPASSRRQRVPPWHRPRYARLPLQGQPHERSSSLPPEDRQWPLPSDEQHRAT